MTAPTPQTALEDQAVADALELVGLVRDCGLDKVSEFISHGDRMRIVDMAVALACMVDVDRTANELLTWMRAPEKRCPRCQMTKPYTAFYRDRSNRDGCSGYCKWCVEARRQGAGNPRALRGVSREAV